MTQQLVAVAVTDEGEVSPHAGRALNWHVYAIHEGKPQFSWALTLSEAGCLHEWHVQQDPERHPLHAVDIAIAGSGGDGVKRQLQQRKTQLVETAECNVIEAINHFVAGDLKPGKGHDDDQCLDPEHRKTRQV